MNLSPISRSVNKSKNKSNHQLYESFINMNESLCVDRFQKCLDHEDQNILAQCDQLLLGTTQAEKNNKKSLLSTHAKLSRLEQGHV